MRRYSEKERARILRAYSQFDGSQSSFCRENGVSVGTLQSWLRLERVREPRSGFVEVRGGTGTPEAIIVRAAGAEIAFATPPEPAYLAQVIRALA